MARPLVPADFEVPTQFTGPGFRLEPLGAEHNERDHEAWMSSIDHINATPGFADWPWPEPMSLEANLSDLIGHAEDFSNRSGFTYSILDGDEVIGCLYIYPSAQAAFDAEVRSWVRADRKEMDRIVWKSLSNWLATEWPFRNPHYAARD